MPVVTLTKPVEAEMTVGELQTRLKGLDPKTYVVVYREGGKDGQFFDVEDAVVSKGTARQHPDGKLGFAFDGTGPATWLFINIDES